jgi:hypothetical protein
VKDRVSASRFGLYSLDNCAAIVCRYLSDGSPATNSLTATSVPDDGLTGTVDPPVRKRFSVMTQLHGKA